MVVGHQQDKIVSLSCQGKCTFDIEMSSHRREFSQSSERKSTSLTSSGSYCDSSTSKCLEFEPKNSGDNYEPLKR